MPSRITRIAVALSLLSVRMYRSRNASKLVYISSGPSGTTVCEGPFVLRQWRKCAHTPLIICGDANRTVGWMKFSVPTLTCASTCLVMLPRDLAPALRAAQHYALLHSIRATQLGTLHTDTSSKTTQNNTTTTIIRTQIYPADLS